MAKRQDKPVALITGAARGIGRGISLELAKEGFQIAGCDIVYDPENKKAGLFEVQQRVEQLGVAFLPIKGDVASFDDHEKILHEVLKKFDRLDLLVNNAGVAPKVRMDFWKQPRKASTASWAST